MPGIESGVPLLLAVAVSPGETRGLLELLALLLGATKWPALALFAGAGLVAYTQHEEGSEGVSAIAFLVGCFALGWFLAGLAAS